MEVYKLINRSSSFNKGWELYKENSLIASTFKTDLPTITFSDEVAKELGIVNPMILAREATIMNNYDSENDTFKHGFVVGYNQALSDNKEKLFRLEDIRKAILFGVGINTVISDFSNREFNAVENFIQSLTKQKWNCFGELKENNFLINKIIK